MIRAAIDWGSSRFRAYRFNNNFEIVDTRDSATGIKYVVERSFEDTLRKQIGDWLKPGDTIILSGMAGSQNGWVESKYISCPAYLDDLGSNCTELILDDLILQFLPGICQSSPADVMRGEELQLLGATESHNSGIFVMPGTHSKWALMKNRSIDRFHTFPTGELYDLLLNQSLIGSLLTSNSWDQAAFSEAIKLGYEDSQFLNNLFLTRSRVLLEQMHSSSVPAWLSGLLIGSEIREGSQLIKDLTKKIFLIGTIDLCEKYGLALQQLKIEYQQISSKVTINAFTSIARQMASLRK